MRGVTIFWYIPSIVSAEGVIILSHAQSPLSTGRYVRTWNRWRNVHGLVLQVVYLFLRPWTDRSLSIQCSALRVYSYHVPINTLHCPTDDQQRDTQPQISPNRAARYHSISATLNQSRHLLCKTFVLCHQLRHQCLDTLSIFFYQFHCLLVEKPI